MSARTDGAVTVTLADVWAEVRRCHEAVLLMQPQAGAIADHETRLRSVERWRYSMPAALLITLGNLLYTWLTNKGH